MVELLRYQLFLLTAALFLQAWRISLANLDNIKSWAVAATTSSVFFGGVVGEPTSTANAILVVVVDVLVKYMPLWTMLFLGIYALTCVLLRVSNMVDRPDAIMELTNEMEVAKGRLMERGYSFKRLIEEG
jgi:hypothetical protein